LSVTFVTSTQIKARDQASGTFRRVGAAADRMARATRNARRAVDAAARAGVRGATITGLAIAAAAKNSLSVAKNFQEARNAVFARLPDATQDQLNSLEQQAKELGAVTSFSATEAANAQEQFAAAGLKVNEILSATPRALSLAAAEAMGLGESAGIITNTLNQFGLEVTESQRVVDVLARGSSLAKTDVSKLGEALVKVGVSANNFRVPLEGTVAAVLALQDTGIQPSIAGNSLAKIIGILGTPTGESLKKLKELGLGLSDFFEKNANGDVEFKGFVNMLNALEAAGATNLDFNQIFGREFATAALAIRGQQEQLISNQRELENSFGAAEQAAETRFKDLPGVFASLNSAWEGFNLALEKSGAFDFVIEKLKELTQWFRDLTNDPERLKEWADWFRRIATNIGLAVAALFALSKIANTLESVSKITAFLQSATGIGAKAAGATGTVAKKVLTDSRTLAGTSLGTTGAAATGTLGKVAAGVGRGLPPVAALTILAEAMRSSLNGAGINPTQRQQAIAERDRIAAQREADKNAIANRFNTEFGNGKVDVTIRLQGEVVDTDVSSRGNVGTSMEILP